MKFRNATFVLMLGVLTLFLCVGKHLLSSAPEFPATVTTVDQDGNVRNFRIQYNADNEIIADVPYLGDSGKYKVTVTILNTSVTYTKSLTYINP